MGFVTYENGHPAAKASVFVQHAGNFRVFLKRIETDEQGYFRADGLPGDEPYFAFALPAGEETAFREFQYFSVPALRREVWVGLTIHAHRVSGEVARMSPDSFLQLVRTEPEGDRAITRISVTPSGSFSIANVPHGKYRVVHIYTQGGEPIARSVPFEVVERKPEVIIQWE